MTEDAIGVHDLHATLLNLLGVDHERLTFRSRVRDFRPTDVAGVVRTDLLARGTCRALHARASLSSGAAIRLRASERGSTR